MKIKLSNKELRTHKLESSENKKTILLFHQAGDLYGSGKMFKMAVLSMDRNKFDLIVVLAGDGILREDLEKEGIEVIIYSGGIIKRGNFNLAGICKLPFQLIRGVLEIERLLNGRSIDIVYVSTIVILPPIFWGALKRKKLIWHVHEILDKPYWLCKVFSVLMCGFSDKVIFVSAATKSNYTNAYLPLNKKSIVIYNCHIDDTILTQSSSEVLMSIKKRSGIVIGLIGRISRLKGQDKLLDAIAMLSDTLRKNISVILVGDPPPGLESYADYINQKIAVSPLKDNVFVVPYTRNIKHFYEAIDILVVPSVEPESFGLVAVEAMYHGCSVIASDIGGLREIVTHQVNGLLTPPGSVDELKNAIENLIKNDALRIKLSSEAKRTVELRFGCERFSSEIRNAIDNLLE